MADRHIPFVEALTGEIRTITHGPDSSLKVDQKKGNIKVPLGEGKLAEYMRAKSIATLKWSPKNPRGIRGLDKELLGAVENVRVESKLQAATGLRNPVRKYTSDFLEQFVEMHKDDRESLVHMMLQTLGTEDWEAFVHAADTSPSAAWDRHLQNAFQSVCNWRINRPTYVGEFNTTVGCTKELQDWINQQPESDEDSESNPYDPGDGDGLEALEENFDDCLWENDIDGGFWDYDYQNDNPDEIWAEMEIVEPKLAITLPPKIYSRSLRADAEGFYPRYVYRQHIDGCIYAQRTRRPGGGSVLIDLSGSMALSAGQVQEIMHAMSANVIATYSGVNSDQKGELRIIARNGKRAANGDCAFTWGGNEIDGPALEWLARQPAPRFWVSDGQVCSYHGTFQSQLSHCYQVCKRANIRRVDSADAMVWIASRSTH